MIWLWLAFAGIVIVLLALDLGVFHRHAHRVEIKEAAIWTAVWIAVGLSFGALVYPIYEHHWLGAALPRAPGGESADGGQALWLYLTGYVLEKSLSIDNIFVMAVIFGHFSVAPEHQHRVLFWGILGAVVTRGAMIFGGVWLLERFGWLFYVFGGYLAFTGARMIFSREKERDPERSWYVRAARRVLNITSDFSGPRFVVRREGKLAFTTLFLVLLVIEATDVVFALDSVPAVLAITTDPFIVLTSNVFAILGLRSLYFVLAAMIDRFAYLKYALAGILVFIGLKMAVHELIHVPTLVSLGVILALFAAGVGVSLRRGRDQSQRA